MLQSSEAQISAAPPQSPQYFVYTVRAGARACVTPITINCGDCGGNQLLCGFEASAAMDGLTRLGDGR
jgi:hypothetical protein